MHRPSRKGMVAVAAITAIAGSAALTNVAAAEAAADAPAQPRGLLDGLLNPILAPITSVLPPQLASVLTTVTSLDPAQVTQVLGGLGAGDLGSLLAAAGTVEQVLALVDGLTGTQLADALATLTPEQQQQVGQNIQTAQANRPAAKVPVVAAPAAKLSTNYRAKVTGAKVNSKKTSIAVTFSCPAAAPKGCYLEISGKLAGSNAFTKKAFLMLRNTSQDHTFKLKSSATKRLKNKGGKVKVTATTGFVTQGPVSKTATVKAPKKKSKVKS